MIGMFGASPFFRLADRWEYVPVYEKPSRFSLLPSLLLLASSVGIILSLYLPWSVCFLPLGLGLPLYGGPFKVLSGFSTFTSPVIFPESGSSGILIILVYFSCSVLLFIIELASLMRRAPNLYLGLFCFSILFSLLMVTISVILGFTGIYVLTIISPEEIIYVFTYASVSWIGPICMLACSVPILVSGVLLIKREYRPGNHYEEVYFEEL